MNKVVFNRFLSCVLGVLLILTTIFIFPLSSTVKADEDGIRYGTFFTLDFDSEEDYPFVEGHLNCGTLDNISFKDSKAVFFVSSNNRDTVHYFIKIPSMYFVPDKGYNFSFNFESYTSPDDISGSLREDKYGEIKVRLYGFCEGGDIVNISGLDSRVIGDCYTSYGNYEYSVPYLNNADLDSVEYVCFGFCVDREYSSGYYFSIDKFSVKGYYNVIPVEELSHDSISLKEEVLKTFQIACGVALGVCAVIFVVSIIPRRKRK